MNQYEMIAIIVVVVMIAGVMKARFQAHSRVDSDPAEETEKLRLREEVKELKDRLHVLERIATEKENSLARQIDELRDR